LTVPRKCHDIETVLGDTGSGRKRPGRCSPVPAGYKPKISSYRWWPVQEVLSRSECFYPGKLPAPPGAFPDGQNTDKPPELWS
jgi:hypothetical protein